MKLMKQSLKQNSLVNRSFKMRKYRLELINSLIKKYIIVNIILKILNCFTFNINLYYDYKIRKYKFNSLKILTNSNLFKQQ